VYGRVVVDFGGGSKVKVWLKSERYSTVESLLIFSNSEKQKYVILN